MPTKITVPSLGEGVEEVTIVKWLKSEGEAIDEYDGVVEVETDKVVTEIPSPTSGTLIKIEVPGEGAVVPVGTVLAWIGESGESVEGQGGDAEGEVTVLEIPSETPEMQKSGDREVSTPTTSGMLENDQVFSTIKSGRDPNLGFISPVVAKIASERDIDLSKIPGTGLGGRITKSDVINYVDSGPRPDKPEFPAPSPPKPGPPKRAEPGTIIPLTTIRKRIAEHMIMSKRTSAHVTTLMEVDMSKVVAHRHANKAEFASQGARLTFTAYFVASTVEALKTYPIVNASWSDEGIVLHKDINIGMATDLGEEGLIVPVIKRADGLSLLGIARAINDLADRARSKKLKPDEVQGATFSLTNHGVTGSLLATPIINQPQIAILGVGAIQKKVVVLTDEYDNDTLAIRPMVYLTLTFDHRVLDGAGADHFLARVVESLENW